VNVNIEGKAKIKRKNGSLSFEKPTKRHAGHVEPIVVEKQRSIVYILY